MKLFKNMRSALCAGLFVGVTIYGHPILAQTPPELPITYSAPADGFVSLGLYNSKGQLVRSLLSAEPVKAGNGSVAWDGTSDLGVPQMAGTYSTKGIFFKDKPKAEYVMTVGKDGNPPYRTRDGKGDWGGNLGGPAAICSNADSVMMAWSCVDDNQITGIQQMDADGNIKMRYFSFYPWDARLAGAMDERNFYLGILNARKKQVEIAEYTLGQPRGKILAVLPTKPHEKDEETRWRGIFTASIDGLALTADTLFATIKADDALFIIDRATGSIRKQITIDSPRDVKVANGHLLLQSGNKIVRLTLQGDVENTLIDEGTLTDPRALAVDSQGSFYTSGANGQIAHFSAEGKLLVKFGKEGGAATTGQYDGAAFGGVVAMTLGPKSDSLWVQDVPTGFPRTSRWSLDGQLKQEWFTPKLNLEAVSINPARPNEVLTTLGAFADEPGIRAYEVDWANKTWKPGWFYNNTWAEMFAPIDLYLGWGHGGNPFIKSRNGDATWPIFHYNGHDFVTHGDKNYFMNEEGNDDGAIYQYAPDHKPLPTALVGYHHVTKRPDGKYQGNYDQGPNSWITWADRNGDGKMSDDEITLRKDVPALQNVIRVSAGEIDADLNVRMQLAVRDAQGNRTIYATLAPKEILPNGAPVYDWAMVKIPFTLEVPNFAGGDGVKQVASVQSPMPIDADDGFYSITSPSPTKKLDLPGIDGAGWWSSRNWRSKLTKFDKKTGELLWAVGRRAPGVSTRGQMYHPAAISGKAGDALFVTDTLGPLWVWQKDGLFLGHLFKDVPAGDPTVPVDQEMYGEMQSTLIFTNPQSGKIYHLGGGTETRVHEITLPAIQYLASSTVTLDDAQVKAAIAWDPDGVAPTERPKYTAYPTGEKVDIDGTLDAREGWYVLPDKTKRPTMLVLLDGQRLADVQAMYDSKNLYLSYSVSHTGGAANSGSELPYSPFVSGAYVDFDIARDWSQPQRRDVREGDLRVILAHVSNGGGDESDFNQGYWQKKANGANPFTITSPAASVNFGQITSVAGLQMAYKVMPKDGAGKIQYTVEVAVPLASLGLSNVAGKTIGFDASVGVANSAGDQRDRAAHWAGLNEGRVVDRPGSSELLPHTWGSLTFVP